MTGYWRWLARGIYSMWGPRGWIVRFLTTPVFEIVFGIYTVFWGSLFIAFSMTGSMRYIAICLLYFLGFLVLTHGYYRTKEEREK